MTRRREPPTARLRPNQVPTGWDGDPCTCRGSNQAQATISGIKRDACAVSFSGISSDPDKGFNGSHYFPKKSEEPKKIPNTTFSMHFTDIRDAFGRSIELHNDSHITALGGLCAAVHQLQRCGVMGLLHRRLDPVLPDRG